MLQVLIDGQNIDIDNTANVAIIKRSKFFGSLNTRTWTIKAGRTTANIGVLGQMIEQKKYTARAAIYYGGLKLVGGTVQILGYDNISFSLSITSDGSSTLLDDNRTVLEFIRQLYERRGGFGVADLSDQWQGTFERGNMGGRWYIADWFAGSIPQFDKIIEYLRNADESPERWPSDEWVQQQRILSQYGLYGTKPIQIGGWSGICNVADGRNKLPYDFVQCVADVYVGGYAPSYLHGEFKYLDTRGMAQYPENTGFKFKSKGSNVGIWAQGKTESGSYIQGFVCTESPVAVANGATLISSGDWVSVRPCVVYGDAISMATSNMCAILQLAELQSVALVSMPFAAGYHSAREIAEIQALGGFVDLVASDIAEVSYTVQERPIEDVRGNDIAGAPAITNGVASWPENYRPSFYFSPKARPAVAYEPLASFGGLKISDIAQVCLHVLGLNLDSMGSSASMLRESAVFCAESYKADIMAKADTSGQNSSSRQGVVGADGFCFIRGGAEVEPLVLNVNGGGFFGAAWSVSSQNPTATMLWGTNAEAAGAEVQKDSGVYLLGANTFPSAYAWQPPIFMRPINGGDPIGTIVPSIHKAVKYTAKGRGTVADLLQLHPNGTVRLEGTNIEGTVEQIQWSSSGAMEVVFWGA